MRCVSGMGTRVWTAPLKMRSETSMDVTLHLPGMGGIPWLSTAAFELALDFFYIAITRRIVHA